MTVGRKKSTYVTEKKNTAEKILFELESNDVDHCNYNQLNEIDAGHFGSVSLIQNNENNQKYALKKTKGPLNDRYNEREIKFMKKLSKSSFVPKLHHAFEEVDKNDVSESHTYMVM